MGKHVVEVTRKEDLGLELDTFAANAGPMGQKRNRTLKTVAVTAALTVLVIALIGGAATFLYWKHLEGTPQYSLALIVDAAKRNDDATVAELVNIDAVVDDFLPQITEKAVELYGRNLPPATIDRIARIAEPVMPAVKDRAREELPGAIRRKTETFNDVPFAAMVLGADKYLDISVAGDTAKVKSKVPEHNFEVRMIRTGPKQWKIVALHDDDLAARIARRIGQEIVAIAVNGNDSKETLSGVKGINDLLRRAEEIFK